MKRCIIIGSGLGGLSCGVILARNGYQVTILEQGTQIGGCLQCFRRDGVKFETGMHFIGSAERGQTLHRLMHYLEMDNIPLSRLDKHGYDVISLSGECFRLANGRGPFIEQLSERFPHETDHIVKYYDLIEEIAQASSLHSLRQADSNAAINTEYQIRSIDNVVDSIITDPILRNVLVGNLPLYAAEKGKTPFATHAFITDFYNQSAFRIPGGSDAIVHSLTNTLRRYGGDVMTRKKVTRILCDSEKATGVVTEDESHYAADLILASVHPSRLIEMLPNTLLIRPAYRARIRQLPNTTGVFTVYMKFKPDAMPYLNHNYYGYRGLSPWACEQYTDDDWPRGFLYMHLCPTVTDGAIPRFAECGELLSYMRFDEVERWKGTQVGHRGADYEAFKQAKAERLIDEADRQCPGLRAAIAAYWTSTPLTYLDYTGTEAGSMYGVAKDINKGAACHVQHKTKIPNLLLTGQNINSHGMLGVLVGTIVTCSELLTAETIYQQIKE
ncbi:phytoene desaturase family protein [Hoylesella enoeca]|uniref:FAD-dependent oxidoreductase n=1 Tax=Hoylesella enoeca TaxID=76123 RepID=A0A0S2KPX6_9BACT|nr:FAD-dependent oxidoreductase [Hoylesella enoeca]ALO50002.1 FAD-dependent oxidoreductase [Hoylesella enoeca]